MVACFATKLEWLSAIWKAAELYPPNRCKHKTFLNWSRGWRIIATIQVLIDTQRHFSAWAVNCYESNPRLRRNFLPPWPISRPQCGRLSSARSVSSAARRRAGSQPIRANFVRAIWVEPIETQRSWLRESSDWFPDHIPEDSDLAGATTCSFGNTSLSRDQHNHSLQHFLSRVQHLLFALQKQTLYRIISCDLLLLV